ncbi:MAG: Maynard 40, partial [Paenibacillus sp.]|nr:Maynard 40 [Paenibacillus sp.]
MTTNRDQDQDRERRNGGEWGAEQPIGSEEQPISRRRLLQTIGTAGIAAACGAGFGTLSPVQGSALTVSGLVYGSAYGEAALYMEDLLTVPVQHGKVAGLAGYHGGSVIGGGVFVFDEMIGRTLHNGGSIIDPAAPFPSDWSSQTQRQSWYAHSGTGSGCWLRC